jgi:prepilin-type N-terminal cleavage/methylation domain-containing protein
MSEHASQPGGARRVGIAGFTLLEILAVIAIIAILTGIVSGLGRRASESGRIARAQAELAGLATALEAYQRTYGDYPQILSDVLSSDAASGRALYAALNGQRGPRLSSGNFVTPQRVLLEKSRFTISDPAAPETAVNCVLDPWGNPYHYAYQPATEGWKNSSFVLLSTGPDGRATFPLNADGLIDATYESARQDGQSVNTDNLYANRH